MHFCNLFVVAALFSTSLTAPVATESSRYPAGCGTVSSSSGETVSLLDCEKTVPTKIKAKAGHFGEPDIRERLPRDWVHPTVLPVLENFQRDLLGNVEDEFKATMPSFGDDTSTRRDDAVKRGIIQIMEGKYMESDGSASNRPQAQGEGVVTDIPDSPRVKREDVWGLLKHTIEALREEDRLAEERQRTNHARN